jgi:hypothetical protein
MSPAPTSVDVPVSAVWLLTAVSGPTGVIAAAGVANNIAKNAPIERVPAVALSLTPAMLGRPPVESLDRFRD